MLIEFIILLLIGGIIGSIGQSLSGFTRGGCLVSIAVGFIGALIGKYLSAFFKLPDLFQFQVAGETIPLLWSIIGALLFTLILGFITPKHYK